MNGKVCLVTGATSGIGRATAEALARLGATVVIVARDESRAETTLDDIRRANPRASPDVLMADLSSQRSVRELARSFKAEHDRLHVLVNCAGGFFRTPATTAEGVELTFALNHLAYFLLTTQLTDVLVASAPARVVNVASGAHAMGAIRFDDLRESPHYRARAAYARSKLANILFTYQLARRLQGTGVTSACVHPGVVRTNFGREGEPVLSRTFRTLVTPFMRTPEKGAETVVYLASSPQVEGVTGVYFRDMKPARSSRRSHDRALAEQLWSVSEALTSSGEPRE